MSVIWIVIDSLRYDALSRYQKSSIESKNIEQLFADFVQFDEAYTQSAYTLTSATSMLSSTYPPTHGTLTIQDRVPGGLDGFKEVAEKSNQQVECIPGMNFFSEQWGLEQLVTKVIKKGEGHQDAKKIVNQFIKNYSADKNYLLWFFDLHASKSPSTNTTSFSEDNREFIKYLNKLDYIVQQIRRLVEFLKNSRNYEDSMIVFVSDHGDLFDEHYRMEGHSLADTIMNLRIPKLSTILEGPGILGHLGYPLYDELIHVPLFIKYPSNRFAGESVEEMVELIDILPTIDEIMNSDSGNSWQGNSLIPILEGDQGGKDKIFAMTKPKDFAGTYLAVQTNEYKLLKQKPPIWSSELLRADPETYLARRLFTPRTKLYRKHQEKNDLSEECTDRLHQLENELRDWLQTYSEKSESQKEELTDAKKEELEDLGYL